MRIPESPDLEVTAVSSPADLLAVRRFQAQRYLEAGYIDELDRSGVIDDPWVAHSQYYAAMLRPTRRIVGTCRFIFNSPAGLPLLEEFEIDDEWLERLSGEVLDSCYEVSSFAVRGEGLQHTMVSGLFYRETVRFTMDNPRTVHLLAAVDHRFLRILRRWMNFPLRQMGPARDYMGSKTVPVYGYMPELIASVLDNDRAEVDYLLDGRPLDEISEIVIDLRDGAPDLAELPLHS